jgi:hypothetical protein
MNRCAMARRRTTSDTKASPESVLQIYSSVMRHEVRIQQAHMCAINLKCCAVRCLSQ